MRPENMIGALDQQRPEVDIASLGDAELRVVVPGLAASRPQAEVTANIPTSLEAFLAAQCQNVRQGRELADAIDLDQRGRLWVLRPRGSHALIQVYGVGQLTALTYVLTLGSKERFQRSRDVGCYLGL